MRVDSFNKAMMGHRGNIGNRSIVAEIGIAMIRPDDIRYRVRKSRTSFTSLECGPHLVNRSLLSTKEKELVDEANDRFC